jgi:hypothetical protein
MFRRPFTAQDAYETGRTHSALKHAVAKGVLQRLGRNIYIEGSDPPLPIERAIGTVLAVNGVASGTLAGLLWGLDSVELRGQVVTIPTNRSTRLASVRRADIPKSQIVKVAGISCTNGLQTMIDLASALDDLHWEQALESALRRRLVTIDEVNDVRDVRGARRLRRVLALRPPDAPPTESLLETLMVQLIRSEPQLPIPE